MKFVVALVFFVAGTCLADVGVPRSYTVITSTYPIAVSFTPPTLTTVTFNGSAQPVSGTFWQQTQPISGLISNSSFTVSGSTVNVNVNGTVPVSGAFFPATQPVSGDVGQSGTWTVQPGNTANTTAWKVDGSAVTQPISGTVTANAGSGPFPVSDNASSLTVDAPVGTPVGARLSDGAAFLTTTSGRLSVDGSAVTQPVSGTFWPVTQPVSVATPYTVLLASTGVNASTVSVTQQGTWTVQPGNTPNTTAWKVDGSAVTQPVSGTVSVNAIPVGTNNIGTVSGSTVTVFTTAGGTLAVTDPASTLVSTATAAGGSAATAVMPAVSGSFHYISLIEITKYFTVANAASATPVLCTTTNLPSALSFTFGQPLGTVGSTDNRIYVPDAPLKSSSSNTESRISCPATTGILWRINIFYRAGA